MKNFFLITLFCAAIACKTETKQNVEIVESSEIQVDTLDKGDVILIFHQPENAVYNQIYKALESHQAMDSVVADFNRTLALPNDIEVHFEECDENNAFYDPERKRVSICYELIKNYVEKADVSISFEKKVEEASTFTMLHELGHALVHQFDIPITGKEENAVDEFAMMMLLDSDNSEATDLAIEGVFQFYYDSLDENGINFADEHAPSLERYFDLLSIYYGANPQDNQNYVGEEDWQLTTARADLSESEYEKKRISWDALLSNHYKI